MNTNGVNTNGENAQNKYLQGKSCCSPTSTNYSRESLNPQRKNRFGRLGLFSPVTLWDDDFDSIFNSFLTSPRGAIANEKSFFTPQIHLEETEKEYIVNCDLPGLTEKEVEVTLTDDGLKISGERKHSEEKREGSKVIHSETSYGRFERLIGFTNPIESSKIEASLKNGQLKVVLPKVEQRDSHQKIEVKSY